jgi:hypothetical protein
MYTATDAAFDVEPQVHEIRLHAIDLRTGRANTHAVFEDCAMQQSNIKQRLWRNTGIKHWLLSNGQIYLAHEHVHTSRCSADIYTRHSTSCGGTARTGCNLRQ